MHSWQKASAKKRRSRYRFSQVPNLTPARRPISSEDELNQSTRMHRKEHFARDVHQSTTAPFPNYTGSLDVLSPVNEDEPSALEAGTSVPTDDEFENPSDDQHSDDNNTQRDEIRESNGSEGRSLNFEVHACETSDDITLNDSGYTQAHSAGDHGLKLTNWKALAGVLLTTGARKLTKHQYQSVRSLVESISASGNLNWKQDGENEGNAVQALLQSTVMTKNNTLPHFSTLQKHFRPLLLKSLVPRIDTVLAEVDTAIAGARPGIMPTTGPPRSSVPLILPSEYARADAATAPVWSYCVSSALEAHRSSPGFSGIPSLSSSPCIDTWPLVANRTWFYGPQAALHLDIDPSGTQSSSFAEPGDKIKVMLHSTGGALPEMLHRCFGAISENERYGAVQGTIVYSWNVHHASKRSHPQFQNNFHSNLSERDRNLSVLFNYISYISPCDSVPVDAIDSSPALNQQTAEHARARRAAAKKKKKQLELAWREWEKPLLKPGDSVVMIRPCQRTTEVNSQSRTTLSADEQAARLCVVSRFWAENGERRRHIFWVTGDTGLHETAHRIGHDAAHPPCYNETANNQLYNAYRLRQYCAPVSATSSQKMRDVRDVVLIAMHSGVRGYSKATPISSLGTLSTGEKYFIYRFLLFWDGFEVQSGKSASGDGIYLLPLNLPLPARSSPNSVRVLSLTPPGLNGSKVLRTILQDILVGATTGFIDFDADGVKRRIFLDLVGLIGDTPALNQYLDVLGHTASTFCHLCTYTRGSLTLMGSRYANSQAHGMLSQTMRGFFQHTAVRDCNPQEETCRLLGMKPFITSNAKVFQDFSFSLFQARNNIPRTDGGVPVVPHVFDPYRACLIAPDHLLTAHFRDCVSLVLKLLPSKAYIPTCEYFMLAYLREAMLPTQNRLIDHDKRVLYQMSMTELYALCTVAHAAFEACCNLHALNASDELPEKCREAIELVKSCSELICALWQLPVQSTDGSPAVRAFEQEHGQHHLRTLQKMTNSHLKRIQSICSMPDEDLNLLENPECPMQRRTDLLKTQNATLSALKCIDKPNVHRLRELVFTTLPMVGHVGMVGELVLEKTHQRLKRAVTLSNNKNIQFHCVLNAAFSDWRGRLTLLASDALAGSKSALLGCYRLLAGREAVINLHGTHTDEHYNTVKKVLGPGGFIARELLHQGCSVLAHRSNTGEKLLAWRVTTNCNSRTSSPENLQEDVAHYLRIAFMGDLERFHIQAGDRAYSKLVGNLRGRSFERGNVVEVLCYKPNFPSFHFPFLVQVNCVPPVRDWEGRCAPALWCIIQFVSFSSKTGSCSVYAAVRPCKTIVGDSVFPGNDVTHEKVEVDLGSKISFLKLEKSVRVCGLLHDCPQIRCEGNPPKTLSSVCTAFDPLQGCHFLPLTKLRGYPPRQG